MLPPAHIEYTWGGLWLAQRGFQRFLHADYRWTALAAVLPDVMDKTLVLTIFGHRYQTGQIYGHTLLLHGLVLAAVLLWKRDWLVYALAFSSHLLLDRMWRYPETLFYPLLGDRFSIWTDLSTLDAMARAYAGIYRERPLLWILELGGIIVLAAFVWRFELYRWKRLQSFLRSGRVFAANGCDPAGEGER
jgi:hypothetical protein